VSGTFTIATFAVATAPTINVSVSSAPSGLSVGLNSCFGFTTAGDLIRRALFHILVDAGDSTLEADEYADGLYVLNAYMDGLESDGVRLGYNRCCNITDIVTIPNGAMRGVAANLAIDLAPMFGGRVSAALIKQAQEGLKTLYRMGVNIGTSILPGTLPKGSGNYCDDEELYFNQSPMGVMSLSGNRRGTVISTPAVLEKVNGFWTVQDSFSLSPDISGRITNRGEGITKDVYGEFNIKASGSTAGGVIGIAKNNVLALYVRDLALSTTPLSIMLSGPIAMEAGDFIDVVVGDAITDREITVMDSLVRVA